MQTRIWTHCIEQLFAEIVAATMYLLRLYIRLLSFMAQSALGGLLSAVAAAVHTTVPGPQNVTMYVSWMACLFVYAGVLGIPGAVLRLDSLHSLSVRAWV
jgi:hypothetical protein